MRKHQVPTGYEVGTVTTVSGEILASFFISFYTSKIISKNPQNHVRFCCSQYRVYEGTNESKRKNDKNVKKYHDFFASCQVI